MAKICIHFVGFKDPRYAKDERYVRACRVFGPPDFLHRGWDMRALREIAPGDIVVFAKGGADQEPRPQSFDDSAHL